MRRGAASLLLLHCMCHLAATCSYKRFEVCRAQWHGAATSVRLAALGCEEKGAL